MGRHAATRGFAAAGLFLGLLAGCSGSTETPDNLAFAEAPLAVQSVAFAAAAPVGGTPSLQAGGIPPMRGTGSDLEVGQQWSVPVSLSCNLAWITDGGHRSWRLADEQFLLTPPAGWVEAAGPDGQLLLIAELESPDVAVLRTSGADDGVRYRRTAASVSC